MSSRCLRIKLGDCLSSNADLPFEVPQGSVLGPVFFTLDSTPLSSMISAHTIPCHLYVDDRQLHVSFASGDSAAALNGLQLCWTSVLTSLVSISGLSYQTCWLSVWVVVAFSSKVCGGFLLARQTGCCASRGVSVVQRSLISRDRKCKGYYREKPVTKPQWHLQRTSLWLQVCWGWSRGCFPWLYLGCWSLLPQRWSSTATMTGKVTSQPWLLPSQLFC